MKRFTAFERKNMTCRVDDDDHKNHTVDNSTYFLSICLTKYKDMGKEYLGEFEELILTMVAALQDDAYGAAITEEIETRLKRDVNLSAVHVTLYRLEDKGYIKSAMGGGTNERGGRRKRIYTITSAGMATLKMMKETRLDLWKMVPQLKMSGI